MRFISISPLIVIIYKLCESLLAGVPKKRIAQAAVCIVDTGEVADGEDILIGNRFQNSTGFLIQFFHDLFPPVFQLATADEENTPST